MGDRLQKILPYFIATVLIYNLAPIAVILTGDPLGMYNFLPALYICVLIVVSFAYGKKHGSDWLIAFCLTVAFLPTMCFFFNTSAWLYMVVYFIACIIGDVIGAVYGRRLGK